MTDSVLEKNMIRKHIYLTINFIILALECKNPQKMSKPDRLLERPSSAHTFNGTLDQGCPTRNSI
jgi:hypothetical protein